MMRVLTILELLFLGSFWLQTRVNLREWWPDYFSIPLTSDYLIPFIYLSDICLVLLLLVWLVEKMYGLWRTRFRGLTLATPLPLQFITSPVTWLGVFGVAVTVSLLVNSPEWWNWYGWVRVMEGLGLAWFLAERLRQKELRQRYVVILVAGLVGEAWLLIGEWMRQGSLGLQWLGEWRFTVFTPGIAKVIYNGQEYLRSYGTFAHPNVIGGMLALALGLLVWWKLQPVRRYELGGPEWLQQPAHRILNNHSAKWTSLVVMSLGLLLTFSRSAWLVAIAGIVMVSMVARPQLPQRISGKLWMVVAGAIVLGVMVTPIIIARFMSLDTTDSLSIDRRVQLTKVAQELLEKSPVWGVGVAQFVPEVGNYGPLYGVGVWREPVHNLYLLMATEVGLVALASWIVVMGLVWWRLALEYRRTGRVELALVLILWVQILALGLVDHYWWTSQQGRLVVWGIMGVSLALLRPTAPVTQRG